MRMAPFSFDHCLSVYETSLFFLDISCLFWLVLKIHDPRYHHYSDFMFLGSDLITLQLCIIISFFLLPFLPLLLIPPHPLLPLLFLLLRYQSLLQNTSGLFALTLSSICPSLSQRNTKTRASGADSFLCGSCQDVL